MQIKLTEAVEPLQKSFIPIEPTQVKVNALIELQSNLKYKFEIFVNFLHH